MSVGASQQPPRHVTGMLIHSPIFELEATRVSCSKDLQGSKLVILKLSSDDRGSPVLTDEEKRPPQMQKIPWNGAPKLSEVFLLAGLGNTSASPSYRPSARFVLIWVSRPLHGLACKLVCFQWLMVAMPRRPWMSSSRMPRPSMCLLVMQHQPSRRPSLRKYRS